MIDFHTHLLPGVDHGSTSIETSISQLDLAASYGITTVVSTSHFYPHHHSVNRFLEKRNAAFDNLIANKRPEHPEVILGAEVLLCEGMEKLAGLESLAIADTGYILLEMPFNSFSSELVDTVYKINSNPKTKVILAHADRYSPSIIEELIETGARIQLNATAFSGILLPRQISSYLERDLVVALGSDLHGATPKAYKNYLKAKRRLGSNFDRIMQHSKQILGIN